MTISSIPEIENQHAHIFPNPTSGILNMSGLTSPADVKIYSIQGQLVKYNSHVEDKIDVSDLPTGIYILNLTSGKEAVVRKIMVER